MKSVGVTKQRYPTLQQVQHQKYTKLKTHPQQQRGVNPVDLSKSIQNERIHRCDEQHRKQPVSESLSNLRNTIDLRRTLATLEKSNNLLEATIRRLQEKHQEKCRHCFRLHTKSPRDEGIFGPAWQLFLRHTKMTGQLLAKLPLNR